VRGAEEVTAADAGRRWGAFVEVVEKEDRKRRQELDNRGARMMWLRVEQFYELLYPWYIYRKTLLWTHPITEPTKLPMFA